MDFHQSFTRVDWCVVGGYLLLTTWVGHLLRGKQANIKDFFLGEDPCLGYRPGSITPRKSAASLSSAYPEWSMPQAATSPTYSGALVPSLPASSSASTSFESSTSEISTVPMTTWETDWESEPNGWPPLFSKSAESSAKAYGSKRRPALKVVTPLEFHECIWIIGVFAVGWILMGGMYTMIWTGVMQFFSSSVQDSYPCMDHLLHRRRMDGMVGARINLENSPFST